MWAPNNYNILCKVLESEREDSAVFGEKKKKKKQRETYSAIVHKKSVFVPICHLCGVVGYIRPNCSLLRQKPKSETKFVVKNINVPKFVYVCHFCCYITYVN